MTAWLSAGSALAATVTINFDVDPDGVAIPDGTVVDTVYSRLGVTFDRVAGLGAPPFDCDDVNIFARDNNPFASAPNVVSTCQTGFPSFNNSDGAVRGTLTRDAVEICVAVDADGSTGRGILSILNAGGSVLDSVGSAEGATETICIQGSAIRYFSFAGNGRFASFDDLRITYAPNRIDFDTTADGAAISDGALVDDLFTSEGVSFEYAGGGTSCGGGGIYANDDLPATFGSPPNAVSVCDGNFSDFSENTHGLVRAVFPRSVNQACVDALPSSGSGRAVIRGYDVDDVQLAQTLSAQGNTASRICVNSTGMRSVEFAGYQGNLARFDNFDFTFGAATIDFDFDLAQAPIASGSVVNSTYQDAGVTLSGMRSGPNACGTGSDVYANGDTTGDFASSPNQVSLCPSGFSDFSENGDGLVAASFPADALSVCVDVRATRASDYAVLRSFDGDNVQLGQVESSDGATETLCISGDGIRSVRFGGAGSRFARFDDLDVTFTPEPGSGLLAAGALTVVAGLARRRRARRDA